MATQTTLFVDFHVQPSRVEEWKAAHRPVWEACSREPECLLFDVFHDPQDPCHFRLVEVWGASREWFETKQLTKPYYDELWKKSKPCLERDADLQYYEREGEGCSFRQGYLDGGKFMG